MQKRCERLTVRVERNGEPRDGDSRVFFRGRHDVGRGVKTLRDELEKKEKSADSHLVFSDVRNPNTSHVLRALCSELGIKEVCVGVEGRHMCGVRTFASPDCACVFAESYCVYAGFSSEQPWRMHVWV